MEYQKMTQEEIDVEMRCFENWLATASPEEAEQALNSLHKWTVENAKKEEEKKS